MADPFGPPDGRDWHGVSTRLRSLRRALVVAGVVVPAAVVAGVLAPHHATAAAVVAAVGLVLAGWTWAVIGRNWRSWGFAERADDLLVVHGALFRTLVVVPYGRMQLVDVKAGPIERAFGIVTVKLHTAAATTDARICGLEPGEAAQLRDRLTALGEAQAAGL